MYIAGTPWSDYDPLCSGESQVRTLVPTGAMGWMLQEIIRGAMDSMIGRDSWVVFEGVDCIERHFDLRDTFVKVYVRAVSVESRPHRDDVVFTRAYRTFRAVWSLVIR